MRRLCFLLCLLVAPARLNAQIFDEQFDHWPVDLRIKGNLIVAGQLDDPSVLSESARQAVKGNEVLLCVDDGTPEERVEQFRQVLLSHPQANQEKDQSEKQSQDEQRSVVTIRRSVEVIRQFSQTLPQFQTFLWYASTPLAVDEHQALDGQSASLRNLIDRGGTVIAVGRSAEYCARYFTQDESANPVEAAGLNLLPDCLLETGYENRDQMRLVSILAAHPRMVGIGLPDNTVLTLSGRQCTVAGSGAATFVLMANERQPLRIETLSAARGDGPPDSGELLDLTEWRRDAIDRTLPPFPAAEPRMPLVEQGALVIVGGGEMPEGLMSRFVDLAGGPEAARLVYIPCSDSERVSRRHGTVEQWKKMGVKHATFIHTKDRQQANRDEAFLAPLRDATGLWFGGGRQWNFADSYYGTKAHELMKEVLRRGGVIGGSSAGASIQARYLARATPIGNVAIMAPGYERGGLGFIDGVAIDQHFTQRGRQKDLTQLVNRYPQLLGIGIDESTAIVVRKSVAEVVGKGQVYFYDRRLPVYPDRPDYLALSAGSTYDLAARKVLVEGEE